jgi:hypothetical protein
VAAPLAESTACIPAHTVAELTKTDGEAVTETVVTKLLMHPASDVPLIV